MNISRVKSSRRISPAAPSSARPWAALPGTAYVLLHHYMGDIDDTVGAWALRAAAGCDHAGARALISGQRRHHPAPQRRWPRYWCATARHRRPLGRRRGDPRTAGDSNLDVPGTFLESMDAKDLPEDFLRAGETFKIRGSPAKLTSRWDGLPRSQPYRRLALHTGRLARTDTIEMMERAYDDGRMGAGRARRTSTCSFPPQIDPTMVLTASTTCRCFVQTAPTTGRRSLGCGQTQGPSGYGDQHHCAAQPELQGSDTARRDPDAVGHRK